MQKKLTGTDLLMLPVMAVPAAYLAFHYAAMPSTIPVHFGLHGPDRWGDKGESWLLIIIIGVASLAVYFFLRNLSSVDPKRAGRTSGSLVSKISMVTVVFLSVIQVLIIDAMRGSMFSIERVMIPVVGIFFFLMGNLMFNIKPNYFVGVRLPWTLENEDNWRKTHHLAGKLWFAGGLFITLVGCILPYVYAVGIFLAALAVMIVIPCVFSYRYFKKHQ